MGCNQALTHWVGKGVHSDWAIHYIGHELTAFLEMNHGQTLACIQRRVFDFMFETKEELAQIAAHVLDIKEGCVEEKAHACIQRIDDFYLKVLGVPTHISEYPQYSQARLGLRSYMICFVKIHSSWRGWWYDADVAYDIIRNSY